MVIQIIQQINTAVELVKETSSESESFVENLDGTHNWAAEDVFEPCQALQHVSQTFYAYPSCLKNTYRIRDGDAEEQNYVLDRLP
jgi:hypothetical protein